MPSCKHTDYLRIDSYASAKKAFDCTAAIRGRDKDHDGVPVERNRRAHSTKYLKRRRDRDGKVSYQLWLYSTSVVEYFEDGLVKLDLSYRSMSTAGFATELSPRGVAVSLSRGDMVLYCAGIGDFIVDGQVLLTPTESGLYAPIGAFQRYVDRLNLSRAAQTRKLARPMLDYLHTIAAMTPISPGAAKALEDGGGVTFSPEHPDGYPATAARLLQPVFIGGGLTFVMTNNWRAVVLTRLYQERGDYDRVPVPYGTVRHGSYAIGKAPC